MAPVIEATAPVDVGQARAMCIDRNGRRWCIVVERLEAGGWEVRIEVNGQVVTRRHHDDWHRVERHCDLLQAVWGMQ